jgi:hypothetical protein
MATKKAPPLVYEVLEKVSRARKTETKVSNLQKYDTSALRTILILNFHPDMKFAEFPEANYMEMENPPSNLYDEYLKIGYLTEGGGKMKGTQEQVRQAYVKLLSSIHKSDAEVVILAGQGKLEEKYNISKEIAESAFPDIDWT